MPHLDIALALAQRDDADTLALMSRDLIETGLGWEYRAPRIANFIASPDAVTLIARAGERRVGFALMTFGEERAHLVLLAVLPSYRRRAVATRMLEWLLQTAAVAGASSIHLELLADNAAARAFYRALGFAETLRLPGYYKGRKAAVRMIRVLRAPGVAAPAWRPPARA